jgi:hypothetical protein
MEILLLQGSNAIGSSDSRGNGDRVATAVGIHGINHSVVGHSGIVRDGMHRDVPEARGNKGGGEVSDVGDKRAHEKVGDVGLRAGHDGCLR